MRRLAAVLAIGVGAVALAPGGDAVAKRHRPKAKARTHVGRVTTLGTRLPGWRGGERPPLATMGAAPSSSSAALAEAAAPQLPGAPPAGPPAPPPAVEPPLPSVLGVTEFEWKTNVSRTSVAAGDVRVQLQNTGEDDHNLVIVRTDGTGSPTVFETARPGTNIDKVVRLAPGTYRLFCSLTAPSSHDVAGMHATLTVSSG